MTGPATPGTPAAPVVPAALAVEDLRFAYTRAAEELARARGGTTRPWDGHDPEDEDEEDAP